MLTENAGSASLLQDMKLHNSGPGFLSRLDSAIPYWKHPDFQIPTISDTSEVWVTLLSSASCFPGRPAMKATVPHPPSLSLYFSPGRRSHLSDRGNRKKQASVT